MKSLNWQGTVLIGVLIICLSGIAIAFISRDNTAHARRAQFGAFGYMPPPPGMHEGFQRGQGRSDDAFGPRHHKRNGANGARRGKNDLSARRFERPSRESAVDGPATQAPVNEDSPVSPAAPGN